MNNVYQVMKAQLDLLELYSKTSKDFDGSRHQVDLEMQLASMVTKFTKVNCDGYRKEMKTSDIQSRIEVFKGILYSARWDLNEMPLENNIVTFWRTNHG